MVSQAQKRLSPPLTLRLSLLSMFLALEFCLSFVPVVAIVVSWMILPSVYVCCGKKLMLSYIGLGFIESLPNLLSNTTQVASNAPAIIHATPPPPPFIPYLTPFIEWARQSFWSFAIAIPLPHWLKLFEFYGIFLPVFAYFLYHYQWAIWVETAKNILSNVPILVSFGIIEPKYRKKYCPYCDKSGYDQERLDKHIRKKHRNAS